MSPQPPSAANEETIEKKAPKKASKLVNYLRQCGASEHTCVCDRYREKPTEHMAASLSDETIAQWVPPFMHSSVPCTQAHSNPFAGLNVILCGPTILPLLWDGSYRCVPSVHMGLFDFYSSLLPPNMDSVLLL